MDTDDFSLIEFVNSLLKLQTVFYPRNDANYEYHIQEIKTYDCETFKLRTNQKSLLGGIQILVLFGEVGTQI